MTLNFNFQRVTVTEFGVGRENTAGQTFVMVPVDEGVQAALKKMVVATQAEMGGSAELRRMRLLCMSPRKGTAAAIMSVCRLTTT